MRPHVNAYCAHENALNALTTKTFIRQQPPAQSQQPQQQQQQSYNISRHQTNNHPPLTNKWTNPNSSYNLLRIHQQQQQQNVQFHQQHQQSPLQQQATASSSTTTAATENSATTNINNITAYQLLPNATTTSMQKQHHHQQHQQQQQHKHLQRLNHYQIHHQQQQQQNHHHHHYHHHQPQPHIGNCGGYVTRGPGMPEALTHNYAKLPPYAVNQQRINECAGIPLISNATTHMAPTQRQRLMRKTSQSPPHILLPNHHHQPPQQQQHQMHTQSQFLGVRNEIGGRYTWGLPPQQIHTVAIPSNVTASNGNCNLQLTTRAARGVPLLHNNNNNNNNNNHNNNNWHKNLIYPHETGYSCIVAATSPNLKGTAKLEKSRLLRYQNSAPAVLTTNNNNNNNNNNNVDRESTVAATQDDEGVKNCINNVEKKIFVGDTCLPRIIKPRKRRKKDRKPAANVSSNDNKADASTNQLGTWKTNSNVNPWPLKAYKSNEDLMNQLLFSNGNNMREFNEANNFATNLGLMSPFYPIGEKPLNENIEQNLRSIWDYPLRRSFSDSSATPENVKNWETASSASSTTSGTSSSSSSSSSSASSSSSSSSTSSSSASSPSRYSLSSSSADSFFTTDLTSSPNLNTTSRAEIVGVIGSNRTCQATADDCSNSTTTPRKPMLSACLSDSNDSGYGDILTGINIANDIFNHVKNPTIHVDGYISMKIEHNNNHNNNNNNNTNGRMLVNATDVAASLLLLPETAETLLNESINEISRKLIETCANEMTDFTTATTSNNRNNDNQSNLELPHSAGSVGCFSTCSEFSNDSGVDINSNHVDFNNNTNNKINTINSDDLIFNFENLHLLNAEENQNTLQNTQTTITATGGNNNGAQFNALSQIASTMETFLMHTNVNNNNNNNNNENDDENNNYIFDENNNNLLLQESKELPVLHNREYIKNCLDLVWTNVDGIEEVREPSATTTTTSTSMLNSLVKYNTAFSLH